MDGSKTSRVQGWLAPGASVELQIEGLKLHMPQTYLAIQAKAGEIGREAFGLVRRGLGGHANAFYALEAGFIVGTPFAMTEGAADAAKLMLMFGVKSFVMWGAVSPAAPGPAHDHPKAPARHKAAVAFAERLHGTH